MTMTEDAETTRSVPRHLWLVGILAVLWNAFGCFDYFMSHSQPETYLANMMTPEQIESFMAMPAWATAAWAIAVWGALLGSVFLLLRRNWAVPVFAVSIVSMLISFAHNYFLAGGYAVSGMLGLVMTGVIILIQFALFFYARALARRGVLV